MAVEPIRYIDSVFDDSEESGPEHTVDTDASIWNNMVSTEETIDIIQKLEGNDTCADCGARNPTWASINLGVIVCINCSGTHRNLGVSISRIKSLIIDKLKDSELIPLKEMGNIRFNKTHEAHIPPYYLRPNPKGPETIRRFFIMDKYSDKFITGVISPLPLEKSGHLLKRSKEASNYKERYFVLSQFDKVLRYKIRDTDADYKASIPLANLNITFVKSSDLRSGDQEVLVMSFPQCGQTRYILLKQEAPAMVDWLQSIRSAKYRMLTSENQGHFEPISNQLTYNYEITGWLFKTGPNLTEPWKRRWCFIEQGHLCYMSDQWTAFTKGSIFIGKASDGYSVTKGHPHNCRKPDSGGFPITIVCPNRKHRKYVFVADNKDVVEEWIQSIEALMNST